MLEVPSLLAITGLLVFVCIVVSRFLDRLGIPALLVFLGIGMLAGSDGPGGIAFDDPAAANLVGTVALAFILFSGGIDTNWRLMRPVVFRGLLLSSVGVVLTAALVGIFAWVVLRFPPTTALLIGAIISSTDAAAVFSLLRGRGIGLKGNLKSLLELESGSNDPVAIFLTLGLTQILTLPDFEWPTLVPLFLLSMVAGVVVGLLMGAAARQVMNRVRLDQDGLYPVLSLSMMLITFGVAELVHGNGFLAVYLCGVWLNGADFTHKRSVVRFHDGMAWLMQILMFVVLGLLVFPSELPGVALAAMLIALYLIFVARPVAVWITLFRSGYSAAEKNFVSWTGLRGAVPIVLATFPLMAGYENSSLVFNVVFFIVLTSVLIQGTLLNRVAGWLRVDAPLAPRAAFRLEVERHGHTQGDTREVQVLPDTAAAGMKVTELALPGEVIILLIGRGDSYVVPRGGTRIEPYDTLLLFGNPEHLRSAVERVLAPPTGAIHTAAEMDNLSVLPATTDERLLNQQVVIVGHGRVGRWVREGLAARGVPMVVVDTKRSIVEKLRAEGLAAVRGDATSPMTLAQAHVARASVLVVTIPQAVGVRQIVDNARGLNGDIRILVRADRESDASLVQDERAVTLVYAEREAADSLVRQAVGFMRARADGAS